MDDDDGRVGKTQQVPILDINVPTKSHATLYLFFGPEANGSPRQKCVLIVSGACLSAPLPPAARVFVSSTRMQLLEANGNLIRMFELITLGEDERKFVEQGITLNEALRSRLADEPTLAGSASRELQSGKRKPLPLLTKTLGLVQQESTY